MPVKTATIPPLRVEPALRDAAQDVLRPDESLSSFVESSVREAVERRQAQTEFLARALASRDSARASGDYVSAEDVVDGLRRRLADARSGKRRRG